jgi:hypothetical protein
MHDVRLGTLKPIASRQSHDKFTASVQALAAGAEFSGPARFKLKGGRPI